MELAESINDEAKNATSLLRLSFTYHREDKVRLKLYVRSDNSRNDIWVRH